MQHYRQSLERYSFLLVLIIILIPQTTFFLGSIVGYLFSAITGIPFTGM
jgi:hypothetical protein